MTNHRKLLEMRSFFTKGKFIKTAIFFLTVVVCLGFPPFRVNPIFLPQAHAAVPADGVNSPANIAALFLAGMDLPPGSNLERLSRSASYKSYKAEFSASWARFQKPNLEKISAWGKKNISSHPSKNVAYPFSGPDIMNALALFPDGDNYILFGLEPVGALPDFSGKKDAEVANGLNALRKSLNTVLHINFFITNDMSKEIASTPFNGVSALLLALLARCEYTILDVRSVAIDGQSNLVSMESAGTAPGVNSETPSTGKMIPGVEISFRKNDGRKQTVRYFSLNISDYSLEKKKSNFIAYYMQGAPYATLLKSASYLMHGSAGYGKIRTAVLDSSDVIIQDDSGIPLKYFNPREWTVSLYGVYGKPIPVFKSKYQADLKAAYKSSNKELPFNYGYGRESNLLMARRAKGAASSVARQALSGGGDAGRAASPPPDAALTSIGADLEKMQRTIDAMRQQQNQLLAQVRNQLATLPEPAPGQSGQSAARQGDDPKRRQMQKLLAEIEKRIDEENARPRKRYVSPAMMERMDAMYYDALRRKIEDKGAQDFPGQKGKSIYGELVMIITINHDGNVLATEIVQSSGNRALDDHAEAIARAAGPFGHFGAALRAQADQLAIVTRFKFMREQTLKTTVR